MDVTQLRCFQHIHWSPSRHELRRFAMAMLVGFAVLGLLSAWRSHSLSTRTLILWGIGIVLAVAAFIPKLGRIAYLCIYVPSSLIGFVVSNVVLVLMFFLVFMPLGVILRLMGKDILLLRPPRGSRATWTRIENVKDYDSYYRQY